MNGPNSKFRSGATEAAAKGYTGESGEANYAEGPGSHGAGSAIGIGGNRFLIQQEAAAYLRLSPRTLERHRVAGSGPRFVKAGKRVLYRVDDIDAWVAARTFASTAEAQSGSVRGKT